MDRLDPKQKDVHLDKQEIQSEKQAEYKFIGAGKKPHAGMKLFALDIKKLEVYEVKILTKTTLDMKGKEQGTFMATVNQEHPLLWAINAKSALKKFLKVKFKVQSR